MAIRFDDELNRELYRVVKNFNEKRARDFKKRGRGMLPEKVYVKQIKKQFSDKPRSALIKEIRLLESYNKGRKESLKLASPNSPISKWELNYFKGNLNQTKKFYDQEINELERIIGEQPEYFIRHHERLNTLKAQRNTLNLDLSSLSEQNVKSIRRYIEKSKRSEITKRESMNLFLTQLQRAMEQTGYTKKEIKALYEKFYTLTPNEFMEMYNEEDIIEQIYLTIDSPEGKGSYELMVASDMAKKRIESLIERSDALIAKAKDHD